MYGALFAGGGVRLLLAERVARRPTAGPWVVYLIAGLATELTHYTGLAAIVAAAIWTLPRTRHQLAQWGAVHAALLATLGGWGVIFWANRDAWLPLVWLPWARRRGFDHQAVAWASQPAGAALGH